MPISNTPSTDAEWEAYVRLTAGMINLPLPESTLPGIITTLQTTARVAEPLLKFEIPEGSEQAPKFKASL